MRTILRIVAQMITDSYVNPLSESPIINGVVGMYQSVKRAFVGPAQAVTAAQTATADETPGVIKPDLVAFPASWVIDNECDEVIEAYLSNLKRSGRKSVRSLQIAAGTDVEDWAPAWRPPNQLSAAA